MPPNTASERKTDRRRRPTPFLSKYTFRGRRHGARRDEEKYNYYVDRLGVRTWAAIAVVVILSIIDSIFTLYFLNRGYREVNPVMNLAITTGKPVFIMFKYMLTMAGVLALALHKNFVFVKTLITIIILFYVVLNAYHIYLFINQ